MTQQVLRLREADNTAVALRPLEPGERVFFPGGEITAAEPVPAGHKLALCPIPCGAPVVKYGFPIGKASRDIESGQWIHTHNLVSGLEGVQDYEYRPRPCPVVPSPPEQFSGYLRQDGRVGVRNEIWILPTVGCVNSIARQLERLGQKLAKPGVDGVWAFPHPYGCSQLGEDHQNTQKILAGLAAHPNAGGVLVLGLGCENNNIPEFQKMLDSWDPDRVSFLNCQDVEDELLEGERLLRQLIDRAAKAVREPVPVSKLIVGLKCGGSDGFSGITANPLTGLFSDRLVSQGGAALLTEVPEMFGAETILMERCESQALFCQTVGMVNRFKEYFLKNGQPVYENPSPGNRAGGITTLEEKSLGCTQKGGCSPVRGVLAYGERLSGTGLQLLEGPGNDLVASTALAAAGAQLVLFTTGRGTPFGCPVPTVKLSSNRELTAKKPGWIDFDGGAMLEQPSAQVLDRFWKLVLEVASGKPTKSEVNGCRDLAIFKNGVTL